jgi:flagellar protein FliS
MSPQVNSQYKAYLKATNTVAKTRQVVMLYDGAIRFVKQAAIAIEETRIEDRFNLLCKASEIMVGLQGSIDFENGGEVASVLHAFYTSISRRIISVNFTKDKVLGQQQCNEIIEELKQMRDVWDSIDRTLGNPAPADDKQDAKPEESSSSGGKNITLSA